MKTVYLVTRNTGHRIEYVLATLDFEKAKTVASDITAAAMKDGRKENISIRDVVFE